MPKEKLTHYEGDMTLENEVERLLEIYQSLLNVTFPVGFNVKLTVSSNDETKIIIEKRNEDFRDPLVDFFEITIGKDGKLKVLRFYDFIAKEFYEEIITKIDDVLEKYS